MYKQLPLPKFFNPRNAEDYNYRPNTLDLSIAANEWKRQHNIKPSATQGLNVHLLIIDAQNHFCHPDGTLYVGGRSGMGAIDDNKRLATFIYKNVASIKFITKTLDSHTQFQIFLPAFWLYKDDSPVQPNTPISSDMVRSGEVKPLPAMASWLCNGAYDWLVQQCAYYCQELEKGGRYSLYIWNPHCEFESTGHSLSGIIHEACTFHSHVRGTQSLVEIKGSHPLTENYSIFRPEVLTRFDGKPLAQKNTQFYQTLISADKIIIAGQAKSHCVAWTISDLINEVKAQDPKLLDKIYVLEDCMSSVVIPGIVDFTDETEKIFQNFASEGIYLVKSTDPMDSWPGISI